MQKVINLLAIASTIVSAAVVGTGAYLYLNRASIIEGVKEQVMESVTGALPGAIGGQMPDVTGGVAGGGAASSSLGLPVPGNPLP